MSGRGESGGRPEAREELPPAYEQRQDQLPSYDEMAMENPQGRCRETLRKIAKTYLARQVFLGVPKEIEDSEYNLRQDGSLVKYDA